MNLGIYLLSFKFSGNLRTHHIQEKKLFCQGLVAISLASSTNLGDMAG